MKAPGIVAAVVGLFLIMAGVMALDFTDLPVAVAQAEAKKAPDIWVSRCNKNIEGKEKYCEIYQRLIVKETNQRMVEFAIGYPEGSSEARGVLILPLNILLPKHVEIQIDNGKLFSAQIHHCLQNGCYALLNLPEEILNKMRKGSEVTIAFYAANNQRVAINMSLAGFTKALAKVS